MHLWHGPANQVSNYRNRLNRSPHTTTFSEMTYDNKSLEDRAEFAIHSVLEEPPKVVKAPFFEVVVPSVEGVFQNPRMICDLAGSRSKNAICSLMFRSSSTICPRCLKSSIHRRFPFPAPVT